MKTILIVLIALIVAVPGALFLSGAISLGGDAGAEGDAGKPAPTPVPQYLTLDPPFVVNFMHRGTLRYLQLSLDLMFFENATIDRLKQNMPAVRNDVILLLSGQDFDTLSTHEGKEKLRNDILLISQNIAGIDPASADPRKAGNVYITNFVMQ